MSSLIESWYFLFSSNALAVADATKKLDAANTELEKHMTDKEIAKMKARKAAVAASKELAEAQKKANQETEELGKGFTKIIEGLTAAATAYVSFGAIKSGLMNAQNFNVALGRTSQATNQNAKDIAVYGAALEQFGGSAEGFQHTLSSITQKAADQGRQLPPIVGLMRNLNREFQGLSLSQVRFRAGLFGDFSDADINLLRQTPEVFDEIIEKKSKLINVTKEDTDAQIALSQEWNNLKDAMQSVFTKIDTYFAPILIGLDKAIESLALHMANHPLLSASGLTIIAGGIAYLASTIVGALVPAFAALTTAAAPWLLLAGIIAGVAAGGAALYNYMSGDEKPEVKEPRVGGVRKNSDAKAFWKSQGYSDEQAAAWAAQEQSESSGNSSAYNQGHYGLYQWDEKRRKRIKDGLGIDVANASADDQRRAAAWEAEQMGIGAKVRATRGVKAPSDILTRQFEIPASGFALNMEAMKRAVLAGKIAVQTADTTPLSSTNGPSVSNIKGDTNHIIHVGGVSIETQATDSQGIAGSFKQHLESQMQTVVVNHDDGVQM